MATFDLQIMLLLYSSYLFVVGLALRSVRLASERRRKSATAFENSKNKSVWECLGKVNLQGLLDREIEFDIASGIRHNIGLQVLPYDAMA